MSNNDNNLSKPHDGFWRKMMQHPKVAQEFFAMHLPAEIKNEVQLESIQLQSDGFVEDNLRTQTTDLLYSVQFKQQAGYIYTLIEHQSTPDKTMPFRLLKYMVAIMDRHLKQNKGDCLPVIYPIVVYTGIAPYNYSTNIYDLFGDNKELAKNTFLKPHPLIRYNKIKDHELKNFLHYGIVVKTMRHIYDTNFLPPLRNIITPHLKVFANLGEKDYIYIVLHYAFYARIASDDEKKFIKIVQQGLNQKFGEYVMTLAEKIEQRGMQIGEKRGMQIGEKKGIQKVALAMLAQQLPIKQIANITKLPINTIKKLETKQKQQKH